MPAISSVNGFTVNCNGCQPGKGAALHSHETCEVFIPLTGKWFIYWGSDGEREAILDPFDGISVPTEILRGFKNVGEEYAILMAVIQGKLDGILMSSIRPSRQALSLMQMAIVSRCSSLRNIPRKRFESYIQTR